MKKTRKLFATGLAFGIIAVLQSGCTGTAKVTQPTEKLEATSQSAGKTAVDSDPGILSGKVVESINTINYTYVNLEKDGKKSWAAMPLTTVTIGQEIKLRPGTQMGQFSSKTLNRTFEQIVFSPGLVKDTKEALPSSPLASDEKAQLPPGHPSMDATMQSNGQNGMMEQPGNEIAAISGKVVETMDSGGYTYVCLENNGKKVWAAVPATPVTVGQELKLLPGQTMTNFKSKSLDRTFDSVIFSGGVIPATK
jgi:hypothetical protein